MLDNGSLNISGDAIALLCVSFTRHGANGLVFDFQNFCKCYVFSRTFQKIMEFIWKGIQYCFSQSLIFLYMCLCDTNSIIIYIII